MYNLHIKKSHTCGTVPKNDLNKFLFELVVQIHMVDNHINAV